MTGRTRCEICGWLVNDGACPCGAARAARPPDRIPVRTRVLARQGRGPSMCRWDRGEVHGHLGAIHRVETAYGTYWCEAEDLLADSPERESRLVLGARVWGLWVDGRWYPGVVDGEEGTLRHVTWDDGDSMWTEARNLVLRVAAPGPPRIGDRVIAHRWDGRAAAGTVEEEGDGRIRVEFADGEDGWVPAGNVKVHPANPFLDGPACGGGTC